VRDEISTFRPEQLDVEIIIYFLTKKIEAEFKISKVLIHNSGSNSFKNKNDQQLEVLLNDMHHADIKLNEDLLTLTKLTYIFKFRQ
jgi:hypothetical protein